MQRVEQIAEIDQHTWGTFIRTLCEIASLYIGEREREREKEKERELKQREGIQWERGKLIMQDNADIIMNDIISNK